MTLLELVVALVLMGMAAGLVLPAIATPPASEPDFDSVLRASRTSAIGRAQQLTLTVDGSGRWVLRSHESALDSGIVRGASSPMTMAISALGQCVVLRGEATWDAARCLPREARP